MPECVRNRRSPLCQLLALVLAVWIVLPDDAAANDSKWKERWPEFRTVEAVGTGILVGGIAMNRWVLGPPTRANWTGPLPGDAAARAALGARDDGWRAGYGTVSDVLLWTAVSYPLVVDSALVSGAIQRDGRMAAQSAALGMQSLALAEFTSTLLKSVVARQRPPSDCPGPAFCTDKRYQSFPSGHTTMAFTGASFTCAVHEHADLYGATWADRAACLGALGVAAATGLCRIMSENHYLSDVLAGALIGVTAGYLVPKALHFDRSIGTDERVRTAPGALGVPRGPAAPMVRYRFRF